MSVFTPIRINSKTKVHYSEYLRTENKPDEAETKPTEPAKPETAEAK